MVFDRARGFLVQNIEIEHRHMPGQNASVIGVGPCQRPHFDLFAGDLLQVLPAVQPLAFIVLAVDRRGLAVERDRGVAGGAQLVAQRQYLGRVRLTSVFHRASMSEAGWETRL